jgi:hypothetical protein
MTRSAKAWAIADVVAAAGLAFAGVESLAAARSSPSAETRVTAGIVGVYLW